MAPVHAGVAVEEAAHRPGVWEVVVNGSQTALTPWKTPRKRTKVDEKRWKIDEKSMKIDEKRWETPCDASIPWKRLSTAIRVQSTPW